MFFNAHLQVLAEQLQSYPVLQVAHGLGAVMGYDRVLVLSEGMVVEAGNPLELLGQQGSAFAALSAAAGHS